MGSLQMANYFNVYSDQGYVCSAWTAWQNQVWIVPSIMWIIKMLISTLISWDHQSSKDRWHRGVFIYLFCPKTLNYFVKLKLKWMLEDFPWLNYLSTHSLDKFYKQTGLNKVINKIYKPIIIMCNFLKIFN